MAKLSRKLELPTLTVRTDVSYPSLTQLEERVLYIAAPLDLAHDSNAEIAIDADLSAILESLTAPEAINESSSHRLFFPRIFLSIQRQFFRKICAS